MSIRKCLAGFATAVALSTVFAAPAAAQATQWTPADRVDALQAGWVVDRMLVFLNSSHPKEFNPGGCGTTNNGFIINERDGGRRTFYAMLLSALLNQRDVQVLIQGCFEDRPRIISVTVLR